MQLAADLAKTINVLYISAEESLHQISSRAMRIELTTKALKLATSNSVEDIVTTINDNHFDLVVIDSIQAIKSSNISASAGSVTQVYECTNLLISTAKSTNTALIIVSHVTKEGLIAGPKLLEHAVDVVMQLEGDRLGGFKLLKSIKNRFGSTNETAIYEMTQKGLKVIDNPSAALLAERQETDGSIVLATMEGSRPLLVEVQALVNPTNYGYPKRTCSGFELTRLNLLIAVLEKRTKLKLNNKDIYVNIVGGLSVNEPAADLAVCLAIGSAATGLKLIKNSVVFGEIGLSGEIRRVPFSDKRLKEAKKLGFDGAIGPKLKPELKDLIAVSDIKSALNLYLK